MLTGTPWADLTEADLRREIPVFINSYEQHTYLCDTIAWFRAHDFANLTVMEQGSTYPPLRDMFASRAFRRSVRLASFRNIGPRRAVRRAAAMTGIDRPFIFTDPDLALPDPPAPDMLQRMLGLGRRYNVVKVGLALDIYDRARVNGDLPLGGRFTIRTYNRRFFRNRLEPDVYGVGVDTTFFLYVPRPDPKPGDILSSQPRIPALRIGGAGFLAGHRPWMFDNGMTQEEEAFYRQRTSIASTMFGRGGS